MKKLVTVRSSKVEVWAKVRQGWEADVLYCSEGFTQVSWCIGDHQNLQKSSWQRFRCTSSWFLDGQFGLAAHSHQTTNIGSVTGSPCGPVLHPELIYVHVYEPLLYILPRALRNCPNRLEHQLPEAEKCLWWCQWCNSDQGPQGGGDTCDIFTNCLYWGCVAPIYREKQSVMLLGNHKRVTTQAGLEEVPCWWALWGLLFQLLEGPRCSYKSQRKMSSALCNCPWPPACLMTAALPVPSCRSCPNWAQTYLVCS